MAPNFLKSTLIGNFYRLCAEGRGPEKGDLLWLSIREPSFHFSFSDQAINIKSEYRKSATISIISENLSPIYPIVSDKFSSKNLKLNKECMGSLSFLPPSNYAVFGGCYFH